MLLTSWCKRLADHVAHFLVNIHVCWNILAQVVEAGKNILPSHPLAAVQPDEIAEIHIAVMDRLVSAHIRELIKPLEGT